MLDILIDRCPFSAASATSEPSQSDSYNPLFLPLSHSHSILSLLSTVIPPVICSSAFSLTETPGKIENARTGKHRSGGRICHYDAKDHLSPLYISQFFSSSVSHSSLRKDQRLDFLFKRPKPIWQTRSEKCLREDLFRKQDSCIGRSEEVCGKDESQ